jgi:hypothetical protein
MHFGIATTPPTQLRIFPMTRLLKSFVICSLITVASFTAPSVQAGESCHGGYTAAPAWHWKAVTAYDVVRNPGRVAVTEYDHCDRPYQTTKVVWKTYRVPVTKYVKVAY